MSLRVEPTPHPPSVLERRSRHQPSFRSLSPGECRAILGRNCFGRLAHALYDHVGIEPLQYVYRENAIWGRTAPGTKTRVVERNPRVAFQVDEVESAFQWRSVVARGEFEILSAVGPEQRLRAWRRGLELVRELVPETFTADDPVPFRTIIFRIAITTASGVQSSQG
jgi:nitroimidazol reductase NimA-like FMN-containing flavoprotein (pyridoxamine 5'-phosphate oxidase superfamily)